MDLGADFGSTYTTVSVYRKDKGIPEALNLSQGSPFIPSVVSVRRAAGFKEKYSFGSDAKENTEDPNSRIFRGFKMLLSERDPEKLNAWGYSLSDLPRDIAGRFLGYVLNLARISHNKQENIENLVICVPETWFESLQSSESRATLLELCRNLDFVEKVQVVMEPIAASAFFAHNYQLNTSKCYDGKLLLIDYGGGTLDITLTEISAWDNHMSIRILERTGTGENREGKIGQAGILYMESVVEEALRRKNLLAPGEEAKRDGKFQRAVNRLEQKLKSSVLDIEDLFMGYGLFGDGENILEALEEEEFDILYYDAGCQLAVTYGLLLSVYNRVIRKALDEQLKKIIDYMEKNRIPYKNPAPGEERKEEFRIALAGGFSGFYLVQKQIEEAFLIHSQDARMKDITADREDSEKAVSLGAALLASGKIGVKNTVSYSLGLYAGADGVLVPNFALRSRQEIHYETIYEPYTDMHEKLTLLPGKALFSHFLIQEKSLGEGVYKVPVRKEFLERFNVASEDSVSAVQAGFSLDAREILTLHVWEYDLLTNTRGAETASIELGKLEELLELSKAEVVEHDI